MPSKDSGAGVCFTTKGYARVTRRGPDRDKLVHRLVMAAMCLEFCYWPLNADGLPDGMEVHHQDFARSHNCRPNLILLDPTLHLHMDRNGRTERDRLADGRFGIQPAPPIGSIVQYTVFHCRQCGLSRKVPVSWYFPEDIPDWVTQFEY